MYSRKKLYQEALAGVCWSPTQKALHSINDASQIQLWDYTPSKKQKGTSMEYLQTLSCEFPERKRGNFTV